MATSAISLAPEKQLFYEQLLDALHTLFGRVQPGYRAIHAKGIVCQGTFSPAATAASVSRASHHRLQFGSRCCTLRSLRPSPSLAKPAPEFWQQFGNHIGQRERNATQLCY
jgi:hypothetical protein